MSIGERPTAGPGVGHRARDGTGHDSVTEVGARQAASDMKPPPDEPAAVP
jgi:hypothetical protein